LQAVVKTNNQGVLTGDDLNPYPEETYVMKKAKNQLVLDKIMEEEFHKTLELFDKFTDCLLKVNV